MRNGKYVNSVLTQMQKNNVENSIAVISKNLVKKNDLLSVKGLFEETGATSVIKTAHEDLGNTVKFASDLKKAYYFLESKDTPSVRFEARKRQRANLSKTDLPKIGNAWLGNKRL